MDMVDVVNNVIDDLLAKRMCKWLNENTVYVEWSRDDRFSAKECRLLLQGKTWEALDERIEYNFDYICELEWEVIENCVSEFSEELGEYESVDEVAIKYGLMEAVDINYQWGMLDGWPVHLVLNLGDCVNKHHYDLWETEDELKLFNVNPLEMKVVNIDEEWPDIPERNGNEYANINDLLAEWNNSPYGGDYVALLGNNASMFELSKLIGSKPSGYVITLPKCTYILCHDYINGSGGIGFELKRDMVVELDDLSSLSVDDPANRYGVDGVHGLVSEVWGSFDLKGIEQ